MGSDYELNDEECQIDFLARKISIENDPDPKKDMEEWCKSKERSDILAYKTQIESTKEEAKEVVRLFLRRDGGYVDQLKRYLNLDLDCFDYSGIRNQQERVKILYLIYRMKKKDSPNTNIWQIFNKPTMENIDDFFLDWKTKNGDIIHHIKSNLEKEISPHIRKKINQDFCFITTSWNCFLSEIQTKLDSLCSDGCVSNNLSSIINKIESIDIPHKPYTSTKYELSPIETFYLRILQHEQIGQITDILFINSIKARSDYSIPESMIDAMKKMAATPIKFDEIETFLEDTNKLAPFIYKKENVSKNEKKRINNPKGKVLRLIQCFDRVDPMVDYKDHLDQLHIISALQVLLLDEKNEIFDYTFADYQDHMKHKPHVQGALKIDTDPIDALKLYLTRKLTDHWYANLGRYRTRCEFLKLQNVCDKALLKIFSCPNISEMKRIHTIYFKIFYNS